MAVTVEMIEEDRRIRENGLVITDIDGLHIDLTRGIAIDMGKEREYEAFVQNGITYEGIKEQMKGLKGYNVERGATKIGEPFYGSKKLIETFRKYGFEVFGLTDNPLAAVSENEKVIKKKLGIDHIYTTSNAKVINGHYTGELSDHHPKEEIIEYFEKVFHPKILIGVFQGENDGLAAKKVKEKGGKVFIVNSDSQNLKELADFHSENIEKATEIVEKELPKILNN